MALAIPLSEARSPKFFVLSQDVLIHWQVDGFVNKVTAFGNSSYVRIGGVSRFSIFIYCLRRAEFARNFQTLPPRLE